MTTKRKQAFLFEETGEKYSVNDTRKRPRHETVESINESENDAETYQTDDNIDETLDTGIRQARNGKPKKNRHKPVEESSHHLRHRHRPLPVVPGVEGHKRFSPRDPRFENLAGILDHTKFLQAYDFLEERQRSDIDQTRKVLKKVKRNRQKKSAEITDNEIELRDSLSHMSQESRQRDTLKKAKAILSETRRKERELISSGAKQAYYLKTKDKKKVVLEQRFNDLEKSNRIDKFMETKRRKNTEKDRRRLPFATKKMEKKGNDEEES